jgi:hypothetical protein
MPALDTSPATTTTADVDVELTKQRASWDFRLILGCHLGLPNATATVRTSVGKRSIEDFIDLIRRRRRAVAVASVSSTRFASGLLGLGLGRSLGEGSSLPFGLSARLFEFSLEAVVLLAKAFVVSRKAVEITAELAEVGAEFL